MNKKMTKNHKYFLVFFTMIFLFFLSTGFVSALEITDYPNIPLAPIITKDSKLPDFIAYFFALGIYLAGALAVISLAIGGIRLITSAGNPGAIGDAKERIIGAILGLVLTLSSVIILKTINPAFITPTLTPLKAGEGVFYTNGSEEKPAPDAEPDISSIPAGYEKILYRCAGNTGNDPTLLIWKFPEKNFKGSDANYGGVSVVRKACGEEEPLNNTGSFKRSFETPGVYYFLGTDATGYMSQASLSDAQEIEEPFKSKAKSILVINDIKNNIDYGVLLHKEINFRGDCAWIYDADLQPGERGILNIDFPMSSINIFNLNRVLPETSGNGIIFYSKPFGYKTGANAGYYFVKQEAISNFWSSRDNDLGLGILDFSESYDYISVPEEEKTLCKNFKNCSGSIKIQGNYLVILFAQQRQSQRVYCQVFKEDVPNLKEEEVIAAEGRILDFIHIIPIK